MEFGDDRLPERFWIKVRIADSGCWEWQGSLAGNGYGSFKWFGRAVGPHRLMCQMAHGDPALDQYALHACDNPPCVNPHHLRWDTQTENLREAWIRGRRARDRLPVLAEQG
jgi:hypothetical protein